MTIKGTSYVIRKIVKKNEKPIRVNKKAITAIKSTNQIAHEAIKIASSQVSKAVTFSFDVARRAKNEAISPGTSLKITNNRYFIPMKKVGSQVIVSGMDIFEGLENVSLTINYRHSKQLLMQQRTQPKKYYNIL